MIIQGAGWIGAALLLLAYLLVSGGRLRGESVSYNLINIAGGALLTAASWVRSAWPSVSLNVVWMLIGMKAIASIRARKTGPS